MTHLQKSHTHFNQPLDLWFWAAALAFLLVPSLLGAAAALAHQRGRTRRLPFIRALEAPRTWDHAFSRNPAGCPRIRLQTGVWIAHRRPRLRRSQ
jgi:hypothetical protein